jgi:hypothetical protein
MLEDNIIVFVIRMPPIAERTLSSYSSHIYSDANFDEVPSSSLLSKLQPIRITYQYDV